ncbi:Mis12 protein-domain-containing protein [Phascolomyces articulosus]|uniref:Mis12 protein-domain-containing protein n=1 Tax=Phascolomyces articulosus TaxID=60185 RepID=A0AAD5PDK6_9FUNG|nr:Mis12 protein-domain-containing protein [Phascolomyces articulosus]
MSSQYSFYENFNDYPKRSVGRTYNKTELLAEFLGFLPIQLADDIYNAYNVVFYTALESLEKYLKSLDGLHITEIDEALKRMEEKIEKVLDEKFNTFEKYLYDHILRVSGDIYIPMEHYKGLDLSVTEEQEDLLDQEIDRCKKAVLSQKTMNHILKNKINQVDRDSKALDSYVESTQALANISETQFATHPNDVMRFTSDQCEHLRRSMLVLLQFTNDDDLMKKLTTPDKRLKYMLDDVQSKLEAYRENNKP